MSAEDVVACPFCGGSAYIEREHDPDGFGIWYSVKCRKCFAQSSPKYASHGCDCPLMYQEVRDRWNKRDTASQARYERLRGLVEEAAGSLRGLYKHHKCQVGIASEITFDEMAAEGHGCAMQAYKNAADLVDTLLADGGEANDNEVEG